MKNGRLIELICALLVCLFVYAAASKLLAYNDFRAALYNQPIPHWSAELLSWLLPIVELVAAGLLMSPGTKLLGLYASGLLMFVFTGYVALVLAGGFGRIPCTCGGLLKNMGWKTHLIFNIFFLFLAVAGIVLVKKKQKARDSPFSPVA